MFEDITNVRPNVKEEIKEVITSQLKRAYDKSLEQGHDKKVIKFFEAELTDEKIDEIVKLHVEYFTTEELIEVLDWVKSDLGIKTAKFSEDVMNPLLVDIFNKVFQRMMMEDL